MNLENLSDDFWISPADARAALGEVHKSAVSLNHDFARSPNIPVDERAAWNRWYAQFQQYYTSVIGSFASWRLLDSTGVLSESERLVTDLAAWRMRYQHFTGDKPTTAAPVRLHAGPTMDGLGAALRGAAALLSVGLLWRIYGDVR